MRRLITLKVAGYEQPTWDDVHNGMRKGAALAEPQLQAQREEIEKLRAELEVVKAEIERLKRLKRLL